MPERFVVLEDDGKQQDALEEALRKRFYNCDVQLFSTELGFKEMLPAFASNPPSCFLLDSMVTYAYPAHGQDLEEFLAAHALREKLTAGIRCLQGIRESPPLVAVPAILFTVLRVSDLDAGGLERPAELIESLNATFVEKIDSIDEVLDVAERILHRHVG